MAANMVGVNALRGRGRLLGFAGLAVLLASFDGSVLFLALPAVAAEFRAPVPELSNLGSALALGALGALPLATLADRHGRRRLIVLGVAGFSLANLASSLAGSITALAVARMVAVCFETLVTGVATALVVEEVPAGHRGLAVSGLTLAAGLGTGLTVLAYPLLAPHWRLLYLAGGAGLPLALLIWYRLPEGRTWSTAGPAVSALGLLWEGTYRRRLAILSAASLLGAVLLAPASLFVVLYGTDRLGLSPAQISVIVVAAGLVGGAGFAAGGWLSDRFGRRGLGAGLAALTAVAAGLTFVSGSAGYWAGNLVWSGLASAAVPVLGAWFAELFPTRARATAEAAGSVAGAVGAVVGLQLVARLLPALGLGGAILVAAAAAVAGAGCLLWLPETRAQPLPD